MPKSVPFQLPLPLTRSLEGVGGNIRMARLRRRLPMSIVAERAGISRVTLSKVEHGDASVTMGAYASVLFALGLDGDLPQLAKDDSLGRMLDDARVEMRQRIRLPRRHTPGSPS